MSPEPLSFLDSLDKNAKEIADRPAAGSSPTTISSLTASPSTSKGESPTSNGLLKQRLLQKLQEKKYFDSGDYALAKVGRPVQVGTTIPSPERFLASGTSSNGSLVGKSPIKEVAASMESLLLEDENSSELDSAFGSSEACRILDFAIPHDKST